MVAKKAANTKQEKDRSERLFHPVRPMGVARAMMKAGYGTRKRVEDMVREGRVEVDTEPVTDPGRRVGPEQTITLDGKPLVHQVPRYFMLHKPGGSVCTPHERPGRRLVESYLPRDIPGLGLVGRLDYRTSGLMLAANDRAWCRLLTGNPRLEQEYRVRLQGVLDENQVEILTAGVMLPKLGLFKPRTVTIMDRGDGWTDLKVVLGEGRGRHIRRVFGALHNKVMSLRRVRIGDVELGDLKPGAFRQLTGKEVEHLRGMARGSREAESPSGKGKIS